MNIRLLILGACLSSNLWAGVYKCTDATGHHFYQSSPCTEDLGAVQMNPKTGSSRDVTAQEMQDAEQAERKQRQLAEEQAQREAELAAIQQRNQQAKTEYELTQSMIRQNSAQFSAYAIPFYDPEALPAIIKHYESRLVDIERFRRLAAQKALATGQCQRVEADELSPKSTHEALVFMIDCSSGVTFYFEEAELKE